MTTDGTIYTNDGTPVFPYMQGLVKPLRHAFNQAQRSFDKRHVELERKSLGTVTFEFQGGLVKVSGRKLKPGAGVYQSKRGLVTEFSAKSRVNLLEKFARVDWQNHKAVFITLTYHNQIPDERSAKSDLRALLKRIWRGYGHHASVWRMEYQPARGAVHFHVIVFDLPYLPKGELLTMWREVTNDETITMTRIELLYNRKKAMRYLAKYLAKPAVSRSGVEAEQLLDLACLVCVLGGLDTLPYPAEGEEKTSAGRFWGIEQRALIPYAALTVVAIGDALPLLYAMKRAMRHVFRRTNGVRFCGARLFTTNAQRWHEWLLFTILA